jgi:DNA-binding response OmpR family regulator
MKTRLLLVEDDIDLGFLIKETLDDEQYECLWIKNGADAEATYSTFQPEIVLLDLMLPNVNGHQIIDIIRAKNETVPIIMISANSRIEDKITSFKLGADDYLIKPFSSEELLLKLKVFLKRSSKTSIEQNRFNIQSFEFIPSELTLKREGEVFLMTQREVDLLVFLCSKANQTVPRNEILVALWGKDDYFLGRSLDVFISRLRKYFKSDSRIQISTIHGVGFKLEY